MSSTLPIGKARHSDKAKTVFQKYRQKKKNYFLEGVQFPVCHHFIVSYKTPPSVLNEIL